MKRIYLCLCLISIVLVSISSSQIINGNVKMTYSEENLLPENYHNGLEMQVRFTDNFKVSAILENGQEFGINIEKQKDALTEKRIFNNDGKYLKGEVHLSLPLETKTIKGKEGENVVYIQELSGEGIYLCTVETTMELIGNELEISGIEYYTK